MKRTIVWPDELDQIVAERAEACNTTPSEFVVRAMRYLVTDLAFEDLAQRANLAEGPVGSP